METLKRVSEVVRVCICLPHVTVSPSNKINATFKPSLSFLGHLFDFSLAPRMIFSFKVSGSFNIIFFSLLSRHLFVNSPTKEGRFHGPRLDIIPLRQAQVPVESTMWYPK